MKRRYVIAGVGSRARMYLDAMLGPFSEVAELVGICDPNPGRATLAADRVASTGSQRPQAAAPAELEDLLRRSRADRVIVTAGPDRVHEDLIVRSMRAGCDVVTEKPMTVDAPSCARILETCDETGKDLQVTFNYRYAPVRSQIKRLLTEGAIGTVLSVDFAWYLDTRHGADYFRRWHRQVENSGSLLVHKATHHFDLVNWWLADVPEEVFAHARRAFYTPEEAQRRGLAGHGPRCRECPVSSKCPFMLDIEAYPDLAELYLAQEHEDGYYRDRCVFSEDISIWDTHSVSVRYASGALLSYHLHAYSPVEGYRITFNGSAGRLEHVAAENSYVSGDGAIPGELAPGRIGLTLIPEFEAPRSLEPDLAAGGHGGGDPVLLSDVFSPRSAGGAGDPLARRANQVDGAHSVLVGATAVESIRTKRPVRIEEHLGGEASELLRRARSRAPS